MRLGGRLLLQAIGRRALRALAFAALILLLLLFADHGLRSLGRFRAPMGCACLGRTDAALHIVYLHGRDSYGPSWTEIRNRETLRALAQERDARIALPRAQGGWPRTEESRTILASAARQCFVNDARFGILGFSAGANLTNELYLECDRPRALWYVSAGGESTLPGRDRRSLAECGKITILAGLHEPTLNASRAFARLLAAHGAPVRLIEHPGPHELPFAESVRAMADQEPSAIRYRAIESVLLALLLLFALLAVWTREPLPQFAWIPLSVGCAISAAIGKEPGAFLASLWSAGGLVLGVAIVTALLTRSRKAFALVCLAALATAVWQSSVMPAIACLIVRGT